MNKSSSKNSWSYIISLGTLIIFLLSMLLQIPEQKNILGKIGNIEIVERDFQIYAMQRMSSSEKRKSKQELLRDFIQQKLIEAESKRLRLTITDDIVLSKIQGMPSFQKGKVFSYDEMQKVLNKRGLSYKQFEAITRENLFQEQMSYIYNKIIPLPKSVADKYIKGILQFREGKKYIVKIDDFSAKPPSEKNLKETYKENYSKFIIPETTYGEVVVINDNKETPISVIRDEVKKANSFKDLISKYEGKIYLCEWKKGKLVDSKNIPTEINKEITLLSEISNELKQSGKLLWSVRKISTNAERVQPLKEVEEEVNRLWKQKSKKQQAIEFANTVSLDSDKWQKIDRICFNNIFEKKDDQDIYLALFCTKVDKIAYRRILRRENEIIVVVPTSLENYPLIESSASLQKKYDDLKRIKEDIVENCMSKSLQYIHRIR